MIVRIFKFRAWSEHFSVMHYTEMGRASDGLRWLEEGQDLELMQFTGLQDISGTGIYEGDLLHRLDPVSFEPLTVEYGTDKAAFVVNVYHDEIVLTKEYILLNELVVIGNIYENPEHCRSLEDK